MLVKDLRLYVPNTMKILYIGHFRNLKEEEFLLLRDNDLGSL